MCLPMVLVLHPAPTSCWQTLEELAALAIPALSMLAEDYQMQSAAGQSAACVPPMSCWNLPPLGLHLALKDVRHGSWS